MSNSICYCANYYGSINCRNTVTRFGERCKLCFALKSGASLSNGMLPEELRWLETPHTPRTPSIWTSRTNSYGSDQSDQSTTSGRSLRMGGARYSA
ncbi:hypothetical protein GE09DRAFT_762930 [Coniochaeta sp. 2T2.1]|nr:hypothetical protein GE09DRAFT_762930 [Coniochaeta sp. 2T2.1]